MKELSNIAQAVQASTTLAIDAMAKQMKADGIDVVGFGAGEPDFNTPEHIKQAAIDAIHDNFTKYTPASGILPLKEAVCRRMKEDCGLDYKPSQVVVASGAKHNVYIALRALVNPGDEVILPAPFWVSYLELIKMVGAAPVIVTARGIRRLQDDRSAAGGGYHPQDEVHYSQQPLQSYRHGVQQGGIGGPSPRYASSTRSMSSQTRSITVCSMTG